MMIQPNSMSTTANRLFGLDLIKVIACFLVVALHTCWTKEFFAPSLIFYYSGVIAIPLFFMVHGYLLFGKTQKDKWYSYKKIGRILLLTFVLNIFYCSTRFLFYNELLSPWVETGGNLFLSRGYFWQFWFLGALIFIYVLFPVLDNIYLRHPRSFVILSLLLICCQCLMDGLNIYTSIHHSGVPIQRYIPQAFRMESHLSYFFLGGIMKKFLPILAKRVSLKYILSLYLLVLVYQFSMVSFLHYHRFCEFFYDNLFVVGFVVVFFVYFSKIQEENCAAGIKQLSQFLSPLIMLIYIVHPFIHGTIDRYCFHSGILTVFAVFIVSALVSFVISKTPIVKKLFKI